MTPKIIIKDNKVIKLEITCFDLYSKLNPIGNNQLLPGAATFAAGFLTGAPLTGALVGFLGGIVFGGIIILEFNFVQGSVLIRETPFLNKQDPCIVIDQTVS